MGHWMDQPNRSPILQFKIMDLLYFLAIQNVRRENELQNKKGSVKHHSFFMCTSSSYKWNKAWSQSVIGGVWVNNNEEQPGDDSWYDVLVGEVSWTGAHPTLNTGEAFMCKKNVSSSKHINCMNKNGLPNCKKVYDMGVLFPGHYFSTPALHSITQNIILT